MDDSGCVGVHTRTQMELELLMESLSECVRVSITADLRGDEVMRSLSWN